VELNPIHSIDLYFTALGGNEVDHECSEYVKKNGELRPGEVFISSAGKMSFKKVVHTVGPMWKDGHHSEDEELVLAVTAALKMIDDMGFVTVAMPAESCGIYGFPVERAAEIILRSIFDYLQTSRVLKVIHLVSVAETIRKFDEELSAMAPVESDDSYSPSGLYLFSYNVLSNQMNLFSQTNMT